MNVPQLSFISDRQKSEEEISTLSHIFLLFVSNDFLGKRCLFTNHLIKRLKNVNGRNFFKRKILDITLRADIFSLTTILGNRVRHNLDRNLYRVGLTFNRSYYNVNMAALLNSSEGV